MTWAKITQSAELSVRRTWAIPPDLWGQTDIWVPSNTLATLIPNFVSGPLFTGAVFADSVNLEWNGTDWFLQNAGGGAGSFPTPFTADTTHTIKFHLVPGGGSTGTITWYLDGVNIGTYSYSASIGGIALGPAGGYGRCCESFFYTNVKLGTTENGHDIFADDFSSGGFSAGQWTISEFGIAPPIVVTAPSDPPCATLTITPTRAQPGDPITLSGTGYTPGSPLTLFIGLSLVSSFDAVADGSGNFDVTMPMPHGPVTTSLSAGDTVVVYDENAISGCFQFFNICGARNSDGWRTDVNPQLATGGVKNNPIFDYIFHAGAHWILWRDPSTGSAAAPGTFPPPPNHTLNATRISADGSSVVDYPIDTGYDYDIAKPPNADSNVNQQSTCCCPGCGSCSEPIDCLDPRCHAPGGETQYCITWNKIFWFTAWDKPVYDARFASDGTTLWVGVLTKEHIPDPWTTQDVFPMGDAGGLIDTRVGASGNPAYNPKFRQSVGLLDFCHDTAFPVDDGGEAQTGNWNPPRVRMFAGGEGGFNLIGIMDAKFCPGNHDGPDTCAFPGVSQTAQRGSFFSGISLAANPNQPGVCHLVWSEGGDWGTWGQACYGPDCSCPHHAVWDAGPYNRDYRVGYSTWTPTAKAAEYDLFHSHIDRQIATTCNGDPGWYFIYSGDPTGYTWPPIADFAAASAFQVVNDTGTPILFISFLNTLQNVNDTPSWLDYGVICSEPTVRMYDISGGTATELQVITPDLIPTEAEAAYYYASSPSAVPPYAPNAVNGPTAFTVIGESVGGSLEGIVERGIGVSLIYDDPLASPPGSPVYLVRVPWGRWDPPQNFDDGTSSFDANLPLQAFYRVPVDGSGPFDFLDGIRQVDFSIVADDQIGQFNAERFFSDPRNIWLPAPVLYQSNPGWNPELGLWFDRICINRWEPFNQSILEVPGGLYSPGNPAACPGFYYDSVADIIYWCSLDLGGNLFQVNVGPICRDCLNCKCGVGVHIAHRI